jgi:heterodisulfide reductase subunit C
METTHASDVFTELSVHKCYQCGKCTAGCPVAGEMDVMPNQIMRLIQVDQIEKALCCTAIWYCVSCQTCTARCPQSVDIAGALDALRQQCADNPNVSAALKRVFVFQRAFLDNIRKNGRVNEVELIGQFKTLAFLKDFNVPLLMKDALLAPKLMQRGKFHLVGEKVKDRAVVKRIFDKCMKPGKENGQ